MDAVLDHHVMTEAEAHKVTEDIRHSAKSFTEYRVRLMAAVEKAKNGNAHLALGYKSWTAYLHDVLGQEPMRLARAERQDMVRMLSDEGMSTRAIAPIVGVNQATVVRDVARDANASPEPDITNVATDTGEILDEPIKTTGMDNKQYSRPEPQKPRRSPLTDKALAAGLDLTKSIERMERIFADDRFSANKEQVARLTRGHLANTVDACKQLLDQLN